MGNMNELGKHFYIPKGIFVDEPVIKGHPGESLSVSEIQALKGQFASDMEAVAPDLKSHGLAVQYSDSLFDKLVDGGAQTVNQLIEAGNKEFHHIGKDVLGPLAVAFVDTVLKDCQGKAIFPARDATPFFYIAITLKMLNPSTYPVNLSDIQNPVFNRKLWGIEDEQDPDSEVLHINHPFVQRLLEQMGFFSYKPKSFIEVGSWGSMVDQLKKSMENGQMLYVPNEQFSVYFLFTHLPEYIYGFTNIHGEVIPNSILETIADTWEAFPKFFKRPTVLVEENGIVKASLEDKVINSKFLKPWSLAALQGVVDAASDFVVHHHAIDPQTEMLKLWVLSNQAKSGQFTGVLPRHTETWTEGEMWKQSWKWGKIPPLKKI